KNRPLLVASLEQIELELPHNEILQESDTQEVEVVEELSTLDVIETFLKCDNLRIVADEGEVRGEVTIEVELEDIDDLVTEELAEIYLSQGLIDEAKSIYTKLSLLNSEKSVYFAKLIEKIEQNN
ncbi:MAG: hypothetical protein SNG10_05630, partial [Rikenellaceae bacterium]